MQEFKKTLEQSVSQEDFLKVIKNFEQARNTQGYDEMVKDINYVLRDWNDSFSKELRDEYYPAWKPEDFRRLLAELGEEEWVKPVLYEQGSFKKNPTEAERKQEKEQFEKAHALEVEEYARAERALFEKDLQDQLRTLQFELRFLQRPAPYLSLEEELERYKADKKREEENLANMGWFQKIKERELLKNIKENIDHANKAIKALEERIRQHPLQQRLVEQTQADEQRRKKIQDFTQQIEAITARLEKMKA